MEAAVRARLRELLEQGQTEIHAKVLVPVELLVVELVVQHCEGNYSLASRRLGISRVTLRNKLGIRRRRHSKGPGSLE